MTIGVSTRRCSRSAAIPGDNSSGVSSCSVRQARVGPGRPSIVGNLEDWQSELFTSERPHTKPALYEFRLPRRISMIKTSSHQLAVALTACTGVLLSAAKVSAESQLGQPPSGFTSGTVQTNGTSLHYVRGGHGPAVILVHGFPEDWVEYRAIMPALAKQFTVV